MDKSKKVLIIEDDFFIRDLYQHILEKPGFEVELAEDGEEGVEKAKNPGISLILLDIMLPKLNGIQVLKILKSDEITRLIPVVLLTNLGQDSIIKEAFNAGAQGYLLKLDTSPNDLVKHVSEYLANPKLTMDYNTLNLD